MSRHGPKKTIFTGNAARASRFTGRVNGGGSGGGGSQGGSSGNGCLAWFATAVLIIAVGAVLADCAGGAA